MTTEETDMLGIFEWNTVRKTCGPVKEGEHWKTGTNMEIKDILHWKDAAKFAYSLSD
jgi:hypothetical protein